KCRMSVVILLLCVLSLLIVKRCLCQGSGVNMVRLQRVEKAEVYPAGPSCENVEIM
uniref:Chemokine interleukin-8-like domain-containing protein n=1 Tax=Pygocentrus nattereri TaxID=42514 RepID=A0A3B4DDU7_PYGNA